VDNTNQIEYWNGEAGQKWVTNSDLLDAMLAPFADAVLSAAALQSGERVMDVGCGAGALTLKAAQKVGSSAGALGVDISEPLIKLAQERASKAGLPASFTVTDASLYRTQPSLDAVISRFGVMFFGEPAQAFRNIRHNLRAEGRLTFACWQSLTVNDWARAPLEAAMPFLKEAPTPPPPGTPGPFAFADKTHVEGILEQAGWSGIQIENWTGEMTLPGNNAAESAGHLMRLGPVGRLLAAQEIDLAPVEEALQERMAEMAGDDGRIKMQAAAWIVSAVAP